MSATSSPARSRRRCTRRRSRGTAVPQDSPILIFMAGGPGAPPPAPPPGGWAGGQGGAPGLADLDLHGGAAGRPPAGHLLGELVVVQGGEATGAVDGNAVADPAEQVGEWEIEAAGLQVPQGDVDGRQRLCVEAAG